MYKKQVVHAAGGGIARRAEEVYQANTDSTRHLLASAKRTAVKRFVLVSSLAAHGPGPMARESEPARPRSHYGRSKRAAELALERYAGDMEVLALRPPALYGPGEHRMVALFRAAQRGFVPMVHPRGTLSMLSGRDCGDVLARAATRPGVPSGVYFVSEPEPYVRSEMARAIGAAVGRTIRVVPVGVGVLRGIGLASQLVSELRGQGALMGVDKVRDASAPHQTCDPSLAMRTFDWAPADDFRTGAREAYEGYRARGWL